jgi:hypothetical protein
LTDVTSGLGGNITSTEKIAIFGDFKQYYIFDRVGFTIRRNDSLYMANDQVGFFATRRVTAKSASPPPSRSHAPPNQRIANRARGFGPAPNKENDMPKASVPRTLLLGRRAKPSKRGGI